MDMKPRAGWNFKVQGSRAHISSEMRSLGDSKTEAHLKATNRDTGITSTQGVHKSVFKSTEAILPFPFPHLQDRWSTRNKANRRQRMQSGILKIKSLPNLHSSFKNTSTQVLKHLAAAPKNGRR